MRLAAPNIQLVANLLCPAGMRACGPAHPCWHVRTVLRSCTAPLCCFHSLTTAADCPSSCFANCAPVCRQQVCGRI